MKKFLLTLATVALASGIAMASDAVVEVTFGSKGNVSATGNSAYNGGAATYKGNDGTPIAGKTWTVTNFNNNNNQWENMIKCGTKNAAVVSSVATDFAIPEAVDEVVLGISSFNATSGVNSIKLYTSENGEQWKEVANASQSDLVNKQITMTIQAPAANLYYKVAFDCAQVKSNGLVCLTGITYKGQMLAGDKKYANLTFPASSYNATAGEAFTSPVLSNPNNLPVVWSSSNANAATVDENGNVTIKFGGVTTITAESAESDEYYAGKASYKLTVLGKAVNIKKLYEYAPAKGDKAIVNFPMTVVYVNGNSVYVVDNGGNSTLIYQSTSYEPGDVIPAGWTATYSPYSGLPEFTMSETPAPSTTTMVTIPSVASVSNADINRVVVLKNVTFANETPASKTNFVGTLADGSSLQFRNNFTIESVAAGKYNVKIAVAIYENNGTSTLQAYPIEYTLVPDTSKEPTEQPKMITATTTNGTAVWGRLEAVPEDGLVIKLHGKTGEKVSAVLDIPAGFTSWYLIGAGEGYEIGALETRSLEDKGQWLNISDVESVFGKGSLGNVISYTVGTENSSDYLMALPAWNDKVFYGYDPNYYAVEVYVTVDETVGVDAIEAEAEAEYYTLQGVKVLNPENGIYVKVVNGKATKVVL
ncbi:MAG: hypothetical protein NC036_01800 [Muribaculaceae bacterium]|nr:hypothetical protein [Muribaculaceae bacterium]